MTFDGLIPRRSSVTAQMMPSVLAFNLSTIADSDWNIFEDSGRENIEVNKCFFPHFPDCHLEQLVIQSWLVTVSPPLCVLSLSGTDHIDQSCHLQTENWKKKKNNIKSDIKTLNKCSVFHSVLSVTHYYCPGFPYYCTLFFVTTADR